MVDLILRNNIQTINISIHALALRNSLQTIIHMAITRNTNMDNSNLILDIVLLVPIKV